MHATTLAEPIGVYRREKHPYGISFTPFPYGALIRFFLPHEHIQIPQELDLYRVICEQSGYFG